MDSTDRILKRRADRKLKSRVEQYHGMYIVSDVIEKVLTLDQDATYCRLLAEQDAD